MAERLAAGHHGGVPRSRGPLVGRGLPRRGAGGAPAPQDEPPAPPTDPVGHQRRRVAGRGPRRGRARRLARADVGRAAGGGRDRERRPLGAGRRAGADVCATDRQQGKPHARLVVRRRPRAGRPPLPDRDRGGVGGSPAGRTREGVRRPGGGVPGRAEPDPGRARPGGVRPGAGHSPVAAARHRAARAEAASRLPPRPRHPCRPDSRPVPGHGRRRASTDAEAARLLREVGPDERPPARVPGLSRQVVSVRRRTARHGPAAKMAA